MVLDTKPKNVLVKEVNQGRVLPTHQQEPVNLGRPMQEDLNIRRKIPIVKDTLRHGDMNSIEEVLEVPTTQSDAVHVTILVTLLLIAIR